MSLELPHLDACTRRFMLAELQADVAAGLLYLSPQLSASGRAEYQHLLRTAFATGTEASLADDLRASDSVELPDRWQRSGQNDHDGALTAATALLAEREFHRFYIRGLCRRAMEQGVRTLVIYRAKPAEAVRANSETMVGVMITASSLLEDLSRDFRTLPPHGLPQCRDPGLSVRFPE
jgi:hypothetical protein